ncbi:MAG: abortive infection family protein [Burkholderiales bacterium]
MAGVEAAIAFAMHGAREVMSNGMPHIEEQITGIEQAVVEKPGFALDLARTLIESVCKTILTERKISFNSDDDLPRLFKIVTTNLPFMPSSVSGNADARKSLKKTLGGLLTAVHGVCELRNAYGFASHGAEGHRPAMETVQALMVAQSADAIVGFLHRTHREERLPPTSTRLEYEDNQNFNDYVDEAHEPVRILGSEFKPSAVLFNLEPETYRVALAEFKAGPPLGEEEVSEPKTPEVQS